MSGIRMILKKRNVKIGIGLFIIIALVVALFLYKRYYKYNGYRVEHHIDIKGGEGSNFVPFGDFVVKYSSDGISYIDGEETVWDDAYQMKAPMVDVCGDYLAIADKNTNKILIYNKDGKQGEVVAGYPITKIEMTQQGAVGALLQDTSANYIEVYDKDGKQLVSHKTILDENGYPLNFSMSEDGTKMMVSYVTINKGTLSNKIMFYDFSGSSNKSDNRVVAQMDQYGETIVPMVQILSDSSAVAIGENVLSIFNIKNTPKLKEDIELKDSIEKVFYNDSYVGIVFANENSKNPYRLEVYNMSGDRVMQSSIKMDYKTMMFAGNQVLMYDDLNCRIISLEGVTKFEHTFEGEILGMMPMESARTYLVMTKTAIEKIRLK